MKARFLIWLGLLAIALACTASPQGTPVPTKAPEPTFTVSTEAQPTDTPIIAPTDTLAPTETPVPTEALPTEIPPTEAPAPVGEEIATVTRIVDGDTIEISIGGQTYKVRYIGMNTPETGQPGGSEATQANRALVEGQTVRMVKDVSEVDKYGRLLRYVYVGQLFVNAELVRQGWAQAATYPPDVSHAEEFVALDAQAREAGVGLWAVEASPTEAAPAEPGPAAYIGNANT